MNTHLADLFTGDGAISLDGVLDEIVGLLPVVIPVAIGFLALRKGIGFLFDTIRSA